MKISRVAILAAAAAVSFCASALAADLPVKAVAPALPTYPLASGFFWGVGGSGFGGTAGGDVTGGSIIGGTISASVGYTAPVGSGFWFVEQMVKATAINGASSSLGLSESTELETRFAIGAPMSVVQQFVSLIPGLNSVAMPSVPSLPGGLTVGPAAPYLFGSFHASDVSAQVLTGFGTSWLFSGGAGVGNLYRVSNGWMIDTSVEWVHQSTNLLAGALGSKVQFNDKYEVNFSVKF